MCAFQKILRIFSFTLFSVLVGCGGGSGGGDTTAGIGGTGQIASGTVTGFGSIFVNGIEFMDIETAICVINDSVSTGNCQANLQLGMVVEVTGTVNGATGNATQVIFDTDVDGPVSGISTPLPGDVTRTFNVLNTAVQIDSTSTKFSGTDFATLGNDTLVEVSGFFDSNSVLQATYVEGKAGIPTPGATPVEIKGVVSAATGGSAGPGESFVINGVNNITVTILAGADLGNMPGGVVSNSDLVEVRGIFTGATTIDANRVEPEDISIGEDGDEVSVEGLITNFVDSSDFMVDGQQVDAATATLNPATLQLADGVKVEVEGTISGTTLFADNVESRGDDIKIEATVNSVSSNSVSVSIGNGILTIQVNNLTQMEDKTGAISNMTLSDINVAADDFLEIRGFVGTGGDVIASELRRDSVGNASEDILQGPVDSWNTNTDVTVLGITFLSDGDTEYDDESENNISSAAAFYAALTVGRNIKIRDDLTPDGTADEMDLEN